MEPEWRLPPRQSRVAPSRCIQPRVNPPLMSSTHRKVLQTLTKPASCRCSYTVFFHARSKTQLALHRTPAQSSCSTISLQPQRSIHTKSMSSEEPIEQAKRLAARRAVDEHFKPDFYYVGIGSGTTIIFVIEAIKEACARAAKAAAQPSNTRRGSVHEDPHAHKIRFVPTGYQSKQAIVQAGLTPTEYDSLPDDVVLDVAFDGADEVDDELNCIKGGGACLFQEKLVAERAKKFVCVAGTVFKNRSTAISQMLTHHHRLPQSAAPPADQVALDPHRGRPHRRALGPRRADGARLRRPKSTQRRHGKGRPAQDGPGLLHCRRAVSAAAHAGRRRRRQREG